MTQQRPTDEDLVAYLDGELSPSERASLERLLAANSEARERLALLQGGGRSVRDALDSMLTQAPRAQLDAMLSGLPGLRAGLSPGARRWAYVAAAAAAMAVFLAGIAADRLSPLAQRVAHPPGAEETEGANQWRQVVAEYLTLYTAESVATMPDTPDMREKELASLGDKLGLPLSPDRVALPDLAFRRAQLFEYDGTPLGQIAYLDPQNGPVALCIFAAGEADAAPRTEQREGLNIAYWSRNGRAFMLIGRVGLSRLQELAGILSARLSA
jgi:anti-sigma factor RsiW